MFATRYLSIAALLALMGLAACSPSEPAATGTTPFDPIDDEAAVFWVRFTEETGGLMEDIIAGFNEEEPGPPIKGDFIGGYSQIFQKVTAGISARTLPAMAVSYESMTAEYIAAGAVAPLDAFIDHPEHGLSQEALEDIHPAILDSNRYEEFGGKMYSFPFTKSVLVMYYNEAVMDAAGIAEPPRTWDAFLELSRMVKEATGKFAYAWDADASTFHAFVYSMGGSVYDGMETLYDQEAAVAVLELFAALGKEELAYQIQPRTWEDAEALARGDIAFRFRTSAAIPHLNNAMEGYDGWGVSTIPQRDPGSPATVLFGPNISIFRVDPMQQDAAWRFVRYFTQPDVSNRWAVETGYLPIHQSAKDAPEIRAYWEEASYLDVPYANLDFARSEPSVRGWQAVRPLVENAMVEVFRGLKEPQQAGNDLKQKADQALRDQAGSE